MDEMIDVLDEYGNPTGEICAKSFAHNNGIWHREIAIFIKNNNNEFLMQKRASTKKQFPNKWGLTSGHVASGETFEDAAVREIKEENGIFINKNNLINIKTYKIKINHDNINVKNNIYARYYLFNTNKSINEYTINPTEVSELKYIPFKELKRIIEEDDQDYIFRGGDFNLDLLKNIENLIAINK